MDNLTFDEETHTYIYNGVELTSVTTFLSQFFSPFDAKRIAKLKAMLAKKNGTRGKTAAYWLRQWRLASEHGSRVHDAIENFVLHYEPSILSMLTDDKDYAKYTRAVEYLGERDVYQGSTRLIPEKQIVAPSLGLAGTVDLIIKTKAGVHIVDWKTNEKISRTGFKGQKCKDPISHLPDCSYSKYTLQLQLYAFILQELYGEKILSLTLVHLKEDEYVPYDIPIEFDDLSLVLNYGLQNIKVYK